MKNLHKLLAILLAAALVLPLAGYAAAADSFKDVTDGETAAIVAPLQMLGVIEGNGDGTFKPDRTLTRAEFVKMAVHAFGLESKVAQYETRTVFPDVRSNHWARGYINLAASEALTPTGDRWIQGYSDGTVKPDAPIKYSEAVTILMRMLGYGDADANYIWPDGYLRLADACGLTDGVKASRNEPIIRREAARLFTNLLLTEYKTGGVFVAAAGQLTENVVLFGKNEQNAKAIDTSAGTFTVKSGVRPDALVGKRGTLVTDSAGRALTFIPAEGGSVTVTAAALLHSGIVTAEGESYDVAPETPVYGLEKDPVSYGTAFIDIQPNSLLTLFADGRGRVDYIRLVARAGGDSAVITADKDASAIVRITRGEPYRLVKNGVSVTADKLRKYDVCVYDAAGGIVYVSDEKLTGIYENAYPGPASPTKVIFFGNSFGLTPAAAESVPAAKLGSAVTALFTHDGRIALFADPAEITGYAVGVVTEAGPASVTVETVTGLTLSGPVSLSQYAAAHLVGSLVTVSQTQSSRVTYSAVSAQEKGELDSAKATLGTRSLAAGAAIYERVGNGRTVRISLAALGGRVLPASKLIASCVAADGTVSAVLLDDATGDLYDYGFATVGSETMSGLDGESYSVRTLTVANAAGTSAMVYAPLLDYKTGELYGVAPSVAEYGEGRIITLTSAAVSRSDFFTRDGVTYVTAAGEVFAVAENAQCYNSAAKTWFATLTEARLFSVNLTVYFERTAAEGGKIRVVASR
ncbi:MAG: S-layer homology domain-containing protein [Oscillospiraceae bacterium]|jgi:hypothetical protein|nr:S-layer homology domain-containing protein [Oscillospiraceae bacterium]